MIFCEEPQLENAKTYTTAQDYFNEADMYFSLIESMIDDEEDGIIQENFVDDMKDSIKYAIVALTKGKDAMIKESTEAAQKAETYKNQLDKVSHKRGRGTAQYVWEEYVMTTQVGNTTVVHREYKEYADFYAPIYNYKNIISQSTNNLKALKNTYFKERNLVFDNTRFKPYVQGLSKKGDMNAMVKAFSKEIDDAKRLGKDYAKAIDSMIANLQSGLKEMSNLKDSGGDNAAIKYVKKFTKLQKKCLTHCNNIIHTNNLRILRWSREVKRIIDKYSE